MHRRSIAVGCVAAEVVALSSCGGAAPVSADRGEPSAPPARVVRGCDRHHTGVGFGGVGREALRQSLRVGPIALGGLGTVKLAQFPERESRQQQRFYPLESIAVVKAGAVVTVAVPASERGFTGLIYDQDKFRPDGRYRVSDLDFVVRFEACKDRGFNHGISQFDGGVVVAGRRCFTLDFYIAGRRGKVRRRIPADGPCPSLATG
jgi:hypothetical protein